MRPTAALRATGNQAVLADVMLNPGSYNQIRLMISKVVVVDPNGTQEAKLPSGEFKIFGGFNVANNSTTALKFDFIADESLHITGNGKYILAPVVKVEGREDVDDVDVRSQSDVKVNGGKIKLNLEVGMDENGTVDIDVKIPKNAEIEIENGVVKIGRGLNVTGKGRVVVAITDARANLSTVTSVSITIDSVSVQSSTEGWTTLSSTPKTYDLMQLSGRQALMADVNVSPGVYEQIRLSISKVVVVDSNGSKEAKLPSGDLKLTGRVNVSDNSTSTILLDFMLNESLHLTGNGKYILAPVIQLETREDADAQVGSNNSVNIRNGRVKTQIKVGEDEKGNVGVGLGIPDTDLEVNANGSISVGRGRGVGVGIGVGANYN